MSTQNENCGGVVVGVQSVNGMWNRRSSNSLILPLALIATSALAQLPFPSSGGQAIGQQSAFRGDIAFPADSPIALISTNWDESSASPRGGALLIDVHATLQLRNVSKRRIRGVTLVVTAQDVAPGGKGSIALPTLDAAPDQNFNARVDLRLLRPIQKSGSGSLVRISLDGVLFDDLGFFGPNQLNSRRSMTVWELEARRDRQYFRGVLEKAGMDGLGNAMVAARQRAADRHDVGVRMVRGGRITNVEIEQQVQFAFLNTTESPVEPVGGTARVAGNEASAPHFEIRNRSDKWVQHVEIGWLVRDQQGQEFLAGSVPAAPSLGPGQRTQIKQDALLRFPEKMVIREMTGLVTNVEYGDGQLWIPSRAALNNPRLAHVIPPSPEEQRLLQIYRNKGLQAVVDDLKRDR